MSDPASARSLDTAFFWDGLESGELRYQVCDDCATPRHPPRPVCALCASPRWSVRVASGRGSLHSFTVVHRPAQPDRDMPYAVGLVDLDEGVRLVGELDASSTGQAPVIDSRVQVRFEARPGGVRPVFEPESTSAVPTEDHHAGGDPRT